MSYALLQLLTQQANLMLKLKRTATAMRNLSPMYTGPMDPTQQRLQLWAERLITVRTADLARLLEITITHAAIWADQLRLSAWPD